MASLIPEGGVGIPTTSHLATGLLIQWPLESHSQGQIVQIALIVCVCKLCQALGLIALNLCACRWEGQLVAPPAPMLATGLLYVHA